MAAFVSVECYTQGGFKTLLQCLQLLCCGIVGVFYTMACLAGVAGQQGGQVFRVRQRGVMQQHTSQKVLKRLALLGLRF